MERRVLLNAITLTIPTGMTTFQGGLLTVPILVDQLNDGNANSGLSQASFAINYNSNDFVVASSGIFQGTAGEDAGSVVAINATFGTGQLLVTLGSPAYADASFSGAGNNTSNVVVTTSSPLPAPLNTDFKGGSSEVRITGSSNSALDSVWAVNVTGSNTFTLSGSALIAASGTGTWQPVMVGGAPGVAGGSSNASLGNIGFEIKSGAATGSTAISIVSSNSLGFTSVKGINGTAYSLSLTSGSATILPESSAPSQGYFNSGPQLNINGSMGIGTMLLLTDGDVLTSNGGNQWYMLTPDSSGNYNDGTWREVASSNTGRAGYGSVVMQNGQVLVLGGEDTNITGTINSIVGTGNGPVTVTTSNPLPSGLSTGRVKISNVAGFGSGSFNVSAGYNFMVTGTYSFTLDGTNSDVGTGNAGSGSYSVVESNTGEIFTPPSTPTGLGSWQNITPFPDFQFGDSNLMLMDDGSVLAADHSGGGGDGSTYRYYESLDPLINPSLPANSDPWVADAHMPSGDSNGEVTWIKMPDGSILSYNLKSNGGSPQTATRFVLNANSSASTLATQDEWESAGTVPVPLGSTGAFPIVQEMGPGFVLPDGRAFQVGANGNTALYSPPALAGNSTGTWTAGPLIPDGQGAVDAPGAMLTNGDVLFAVSDYAVNGGYDGDGANGGGSTTLDEFNPTTNSIITVEPLNSSGNLYTGLSNDLGDTGAAAFTMLDLPNGHVLIAANSLTQPYVYLDSSSPNGTPTPLAAWLPTITNISLSEGFYQITGTQLTGISQGASYGDDAQMATNYPIVSLQNTDGGVTYATSFDWSSSGVATGSTPETVDFIVPSSDASGVYLLSVIANGIASQQVLAVLVNSSTTSALEIEPGNLDGAPATDAIVVGGGNFIGGFPLSSISSVFVVGDSNSDTITLDENFTQGTVTINGDAGNCIYDVEADGVPTYISGGSGTNSYTVSSIAMNLSNITAPIQLEGVGSGGLFVYDNSYSSSTTYSVTASEVVRAGFGGVSYGSNVNQVDLVAGSAADTVDILDTAAGIPVYLNANSSSTSIINTVNIGVFSQLADILGPIFVSDTPAYSNINIDDSANSNPCLIDLNDGELTGLSAAPIYWTDTDVSQITISGGTGGNVFDVSTAGISGLTTLNTGTDGSLVVFQGAIAGSFNVVGQADQNVVEITDSNSTTAQDWLINPSETNRSGFSVSYSSITSLSLTTGTGADTVDFENLPCPTSVSNFGGADSYNISTASKVLPPFTNSLMLSGDWAGTTATFDDASANGGTFPTITSDMVELGSGITYSGITTLTFDLPNHNSIVTFTGTTLETAYVINGGSTQDQVNIGGGNLTEVGSNLGAGEGGITFNAVLGSDSNLVLDDAASAAGVVYTFNSQSITLQGQLAISYSNLSAIQLDSGSGDDFYQVNATEQECSLTIDTQGGEDSASVAGDGIAAPVLFDAGSTGSDDVEVSSLGSVVSPVTVEGYPGLNDTLVVYDQTDANFSVTSTYVAQLLFADPIAQVFYSNLGQVVFNVGAGGSGNTLTVYNTATGTPVTVNNGSGTDTINVDSTAANGPVIITPSGGNDPINVGTAGDGTAVAQFIASQQIGVLTIGNGGLAQVTTGSNALLQLASVAASGTGALDLTTNDMIVNGSTLSAVTALVKSGYNAAHNGNWKGSGITSSSAAGDSTHLTALGVIQNNQSGTALFTASHKFDGVTPAAGVILVRYTYYGDGNISGKVDGSDYSLIDAAYLADKSHPGSYSGWYNGDFNYDGVVDGTDYTLIDNAFNTQGATLASQIFSQAANSTAIPAAKDAVATPAKASLQATALSPGVFNASTPITLSASSGQSVEKLLLKKDLLDGLIAAAAGFLPG